MRVSGGCRRSQGWWWVGGEKIWRRDKKTVTVAKHKQVVLRWVLGESIFKSTCLYINPVFTTVQKDMLFHILNFCTLNLLFYYHNLLVHPGHSPYCSPIAPEDHSKEELIQLESCVKFGTSWSASNTLILIDLLVVFSNFYGLPLCPPLVWGNITGSLQ